MIFPVVDPVDDSIIEDVIQETKSTKANPQAKTVKVTNTKVLIPKEGIDKEITSAEEDDNKEVKESDMYPQVSISHLIPLMYLTCEL